MLLQRVTRIIKIIIIYCYKWASEVALVVKNPPANLGDKGDLSLIPELGRSPNWEDPLE